MNKITSPEISPEVAKAVEAGYTERFVFSDGVLHCTSIPQRVYLVHQVQKQPSPCQSSRSNIYRIQTSDGIKGIAIIEWVEIEMDD
jgi:hypothetical protein